MNDQDVTDRWIASSAALLGLPIEAEWMPAIRANVEVTLQMAKLVEEFPLEDEAEPAPVYGA